MSIRILSMVLVGGIGRAAANATAFLNFAGYRNRSRSFWAVAISGSSLWPTG
jgi:hypothetical protein